MPWRSRLAALACLAAFAAVARADVIVKYTLDAGGNNHEPLDGLSARATFSLSGMHLSILLENTSTGVPASFEVSDSLLVSLGFNLPAHVWIAGGDAARIAPGAHGLGSWSPRGAGDSVAEEWIWTNQYGGDLMKTYAQVLSTSSGQGGGIVTRFDGGSGTVDGPFGGIAAAPPLLTVPDQQPAVSSAIAFDLTLTLGLSDAQLAQVTRNSIVEFGSDARYLRTPEPAAAVLALAGLAFGRRSR